MKKTWVLSLANIICLIHCVGFSLISAFLPILLVKMHWDWLEYSILALNLILGTISLSSMKNWKNKVGGLIILVSLGFISLLSDYHSYFHLIIISISLYQIILLFRHHQSKKHHCCDHDH